MNNLIIAIFLLTLSAFSSYSQFLPTPGPTGGTVYCLYVNGSTVYAGTQNGGVFKSTNNGDSWNASNSGLIVDVVNSLNGFGNNLFCGTNSGFYRSTNSGSNWSAVNYGESMLVTSLTVNGTDVYLGNSDGRLYKSTNNGLNWIYFAGSFGGRVNSILFHQGLIYAAVDGMGAYATTNSGANWNLISPYYFYTKALYATGNTVRLGTSNGGKKRVGSTGSFSDDIPWANYTLCYASVGNFIIAGFSNGMFWSSDNGSTWNDPVAGYLSGTFVYSMAQNTDYVFAGTSQVYRRPTSQFTGLNIISTNVPENYELSQNYPNPFNPGTNVKFSIPVTSNVNLEVFNQVGQSVKVLVNEDLEAGTYEYYFDASSLSSGIYLYTVSAGEFTQTKKMILIK